jgi:hypothetical protein
MHVVPTVATQISAEHARDALRASMPGIDRDSAALLLALIWVETGQGHVVNNNVGNITASDAWPGGAWRPPWFAPSSDPHLAELHAKMLAGQAPSAFRAYDSLPEGFADFASTLKHSFPTVLAAAATGDAAAFVNALHNSRYSTDYNASHIPTFRMLEAKFASLVSSFPGGAGGVAGGGVLAALALVLVLRHTHRRKRRGRSNAAS